MGGGRGGGVGGGGEGGGGERGIRMNHGAFRRVSLCYRPDVLLKRLTRRDGAIVFAGNFMLDSIELDVFGGGCGMVKLERGRLWFQWDVGSETSFCWTKHKKRTLLIPIVEEHLLTPTPPPQGNYCDSSSFFCCDRAAPSR